MIWPDADMEAAMILDAAQAGPVVLQDVKALLKRIRELEADRGPRGPNILCRDADGNLWPDDKPVIVEGEK